MFINEEAVICMIFSHGTVSVLCGLMHLVNMLLSMCAEGWVGVFVL